MSTVKNLWGELPLAKVVRTPVSILREQAVNLTELTKGLLVGEVSSAKIEHSEKPFLSRLSIIAPALDNYRFVIMDINHNIMLYPISISDKVNDDRYDCHYEEQFISAVEQILSSDTVHKAVAALLSQTVSEESSIT